VGFQLSRIRFNIGKRRIDLVRADDRRVAEPDMRTEDMKETEVDLLRRVLDQEADPPAIDLGSVMLVERGGRGTTRTNRRQRK
jgi:hypothetical protein